jgi:hypothetical protein
MQKIKEIYTKIAETSERLSWNEKALTLGVILILTPVFYFYLIYPWQSEALKKASREYKQSKARFEALDAERAKCEDMSSEINKGDEVMKYINGLILNPDDAIQVINVISELINKNALTINFLKNSAQFERIYEKMHMPKTEDGRNDAAAKFSFRILPIEFAFRSSPIDFLSFLNIIEGFKNLNYNIKRINASRSNDGRVDVNIIMEIIVELNLYEPKNT